ncbi:hypothetical protein KKG56_10610 [bacterium]|nr:hypothetical protein [bacterium]
MKNEILEELWKSKDKVAQEYEYNIDKLVEGLQKKEKGTKITVVDFTLEHKNILATRNN